jgi:outer membrane PBP1 activator LpoA protein
MYLKNTTSLILPIIFLIFLASCSTNKVKAPSTATKATTEIDLITPSSDALSAEQHLILAQTLSSDKAVSELIITTKLFFQQNDYLNALWLADKTLPLVDEQVPNYINEKVQLVLIKSSSLQQLGYYSESILPLEQLKKYLDVHDISLSATYYNLLSIAYDKKEQPVASLNAQLHAFSKTDTNLQSKQQVIDIWNKLKGLSQWQLNLIAQDKAPNDKGWLKLTAIANKFGGNTEQLHYHLKIWQTNFKVHPGNIIAAQLKTHDISPTVIKNIAVILPLSGKQHTAGLGLALQQGILASYANDSTKKLHFLDSKTINWYDLTNQLSTLKIDYVIGPLLKSNVDKYITHTSMEAQSQSDYMLSANANLLELNNNKSALDTEKTPVIQPASYLGSIDSDAAIEGYLQQSNNNKAISTLLLNIPATASLTEQHTVLSMRPEDEAHQAAATLSRQNFKHPIVLSQNNAVSKRIAQAFVKQWHRITGDTIEVVYYGNGTQMQENITASLAVDQSKARISSLERRLNQSIKTQARNRRDIDMIYLVGTPEQTRLVKPYIEVNISPFSDVIPVFASSRSHSTRSDYSSNNDLRGLTFTEIPWLLANNKDNELVSLSQQLWPKRSDGLSRLFAMGYDSYQLINKISLMQQAPYIHHWGQTGVLKLDKNSILTRSFLWGTYKRNKVVTIAME